MSVINQFIHGSDPSEMVLDKAKFMEFARAELAKGEGRSLADKEKAVANVNKALSSIAGVAELNAIEGDYQILNIYRDSPALDFAEVRNLPLGSVPIYRTRYENPVGITIGGLAGVGGTEYYATSDVGVQVGTFTLKTNEIMVPNLNNIYDMVKLDQRKIGLKRLAEYMQMAICNAALNTVFGATDVTSDPAVNIANYYTAANATWSSGLTYTAGAGYFNGKAVYTLDPGVLQGGIPTTNCFNLTAEGGLTRQVHQAIKTWSVQMGRVPKTMYVSNVGAPWEAMQNQATPVALVNGQGNQNPSRAIPAEKWAEFQNKDISGEITLDWFGTSIRVVRQNWIPQGYAFLTTNEPAMIMWDRLSLATGNIVEGSLETPVDAFYSRRSEARQVAMVRPDFCLRNFMVLKIQ